jgi:hypothetical protein
VVRKLLTVLCVLCVEPRVAAQINFGVEYDRDRFTYHFDNPSTFDTSVLVPHFFEQRYDADNVWFVGSARYVAAIPWETSGGVTPRRQSIADDYDTFFDPDGTVFVSGTTGSASIRSWRLGQRAEVARAGSATIVVGYRLRVDRSDFGLGHKTVVRNGVIIDALDVTTPERTTSHTHEIFGGVRFRGLDAEFSPTTLGRLAVQLPEKYPGQELIFYAKAATGSASFTLTRSHLSVGVEVEHTWSYSTAASLSRNILAVRLSLRP